MSSLTNLDNKFINIHPSVELFNSFHAQMGEFIVSPLPSKKLQAVVEVIKKIAAVIVSPFIYLALGIVAVAGYPYVIRKPTPMSTTSKPIQAQAKKVEKTIETAPLMIEKLEKPVKAVEKPVVQPPVHGLDFKHLNDVLEYYEKHLLPQRPELTSKEYTQRCRHLCNQLLFIAGNKLKNEVIAGRLIISENDCILDANRKKPEWLSEFEAISAQLEPHNRENNLQIIKNLAHIKLAISKLKKADSSQKYVVVKKICEAAGKEEPLYKPLQLAQEKALEDFCNDAQLYMMTSEEVKVAINTIKRNAYLTASGISPQDQNKYKVLLDQLEAEWKIVQEKGEAIFVQREKLFQLPPLARKRILPSVKQEIDEINESEFKKYITELLKSDVSKHAKIKSTFEQAHTTALEKIIKYVSKDEVFYEKWARHLKMEMIQGISGDCLGTGVCNALSIRWTIGEMKKIPLQDMTEVFKTLEIGTIDPEDRFNQVIKTDKIEQKMGIKGEDVHQKDNISGKEGYKEYIKSLLLSTDFSILHNGVGQLRFAWKVNGKRSAHAITICCQEDQTDPSSSVYRFIEPNFGAFQFNVKPDAVNGELAKKELIDCLSDLLLLYADQMEALYCRCFEIK